MNAKERNMLLIIDKQIAELQKAKEELLRTKPLVNILSNKQGFWVIEMKTNKYFQFVCSELGHVKLVRFGGVFTISVDEFNTSFRIASVNEVKQHIEFLERTGKHYIRQNFTQKVEQREVYEVHEALVTTKLDGMTHSGGLSKLKDIKFESHKIDPKKCDFYMVTVTGEFGTKVRHDNYENAIKEATRLAKKMNHKAWVTGVVAIVEPIQQEVQVKIIEK